MENEKRRSSWAPKPKLILDDEPVILEPSVVEKVHSPIELPKAELTPLLAPPVRVSSSKALEAPEKPESVMATVVVASSVLAPPAPIQALPTILESPAVLQSEAGFASMDFSEPSSPKNETESQLPPIAQSSYEQVNQYYETTPYRESGLGSSTNAFLNKSSPLSSTSFFDSVDGKLGGHINLFVWIIDIVLLLGGKVVSVVWRGISSWLNK